MHLAHRPAGETALVDLLVGQQLDLGVARIGGDAVVQPVDGGAAAFFGGYLRGLVTLRWYSWVLALGPLVIVASWAVVLGRRASSSRG